MEPRGEPSHASASGTRDSFVHDQRVCEHRRAATSVSEARPTESKNNSLKMATGEKLGTYYPSVLQAGNS